MNKDAHWTISSIEYIVHYVHSYLKNELYL